MSKKGAGQASNVKSDLSWLKTTDTESKSQEVQKRDHWFDAADILLFLLAIVLLMMGLLAALLSFFLIQNTEKVTAQNALNTLMSQKNSDLSQVISNSISTVDMVKGFVSVNLPFYTISYDNKFAPFFTLAGGLPLGATGISYFQNVKNADVPVFRQLIKDYVFPQYGDNFTIFSTKDAKGNLIPDDPTREYYNILVFSYPPSVLPSVFGLNTSYNRKNVSLAKSIANGKDVATGVTNLISSNAFFQPGVIVFSPIFYANGTISGFIDIAFRADTLITTAIKNLDNNTFVIIRDLSANVPLGDSLLVYISASLGQAGSLAGFDSSFTSPQQLTAADCDRIQSASSFVAQSNLSFVDRTWSMTVVTTPSYLSAFVDNTKWIALVVSLIIAVVLEAFVVIAFFYRRMVYSKKLQELSREKVTALVGSQKKMKAMLRRLTAQETRTRSTVDIITDFICVITATGKIVHTNEAFDGVFVFNEQKWKSGVMIGDVLTKLGNEFFKNVKRKESMNTIAENGQGVEVPVQVFVRSLIENAVDTDTPTVTTPVTTQTPSVSINPVVAENEEPIDEFEEIEAYVLLMRDLRGNK
jgi:PAS domain-containing protein